MTKLESVATILTSAVTLTEILLRLIPGKKRGSLFSKAGKMAAKDSVEGSLKDQVSKAMFKVSDVISVVIPDRQAKPEDPKP